MPAGAAAPNLDNNDWGGYDMNDTITAWAITSPSKAPAHGSTPDGGC